MKREYSICYTTIEVCKIRVRKIKNEMRSAAASLISRVKLIARETKCLRHINRPRRSWRVKLIAREMPY